jgi:hypothetical protein
LDVINDANIHEAVAQKSKEHRLKGIRALELKRHRLKAAEDSRTPRRWRDLLRAAATARFWRFWSAAVLCRFI